MRKGCLGRIYADVKKDHTLPVENNSKAKVLEFDWLGVSFFYGTAFFCGC